MSMRYLEKTLVLLGLTVLTLPVACGGPQATVLPESAPLSESVRSSVEGTYFGTLRKDGMQQEFTATLSYSPESDWQLVFTSNGPIGNMQQRRRTMVALDNLYNKYVFTTEPVTMDALSSRTVSIWLSLWSNGQVYLPWSTMYINDCVIPDTLVCSGIQDSVVFELAGKR